MAGTAEGASAEKPTPPSSGSRKLMLFGVVAVLVLVALGVVGYFVIFSEKPESEEGAEEGETGEKVLIASTVIFRHGNRAPETFAPETKKEDYPNGAGEMTEAGIDNTFEIGKYLGKRYVQTGFLSSPPRAKEMYIRSRSNNRCLMSAGLVGSGMFASGENPEFTALPVYAQEKDDMILMYPKGCNVENKRLVDKCGKNPPSTGPWSAYEGFVYECIGLNKEGAIFKNAEEFSKVAALVTHDRNGMKMPDWFEKKREEIHGLHAKVYSFTLGVNEHHSPEILRLKQGKLLSDILKHLSDRWQEWKENGKIKKRKFVAYSSQDWLIMSLIHALGCQKETIGEGVPEFNTLVMFELSELNKKPVVQVFYKPQGQEAKDVTKGVRRCDKTPCPLDDFLSCCDEYKTEDPNSECNH